MYTEREKCVEAEKKIPNYKKKAFTYSKTDEIFLAKRYCIGPRNRMLVGEIC